jgi:phosphatidylserine/phosphatidylglycerophosphate/cardiolipin synthase-like enzyme
VQNAYAKPDRPNKPNKSPVANGQSVATDEDTPVLITLTGRDANKDPLTFSIVDPPADGTLSAISHIDNTSAEVTYTPDTGFTGTDSFTFRVNDGIEDSNTATVTITVNPPNNPPVADAGPDQTVDQLTLVTLNGTASFDPDGDPITYSWIQTSGPSVTLSNPASPTPTFTAPSVDTDTVLRFSLTVTDNSGLSSSDAVNITVLNTGISFRSFNGDFLDVPSSSALQLSKFSMEVGFRTTQTSTSWMLIANKGGMSGSSSPGMNMNYALFMTKDGRISGGFERSDGTNEFAYSNVYANDGAWHVGKVTFDGTKIAVYLDGVLVKTRSTTAQPDNTGTQPLRIAANAQFGNLQFIGDIDFVRVIDLNTSAVVYFNDFANPDSNLDNKVLLTDAYFNDVKNEIMNATTYIHADFFYIEYQPTAGPAFRPNIILNELVNAKNRGVDVKITINIDTSVLYPDTEVFLANNGIPYRMDGTHSKLVIIDDRIVYVGSANWNNNGLKNNHEITIRTNNPDIIAEAKVYFNSVWVNGFAATVVSNQTFEAFISGSEYFDRVRDHLEHSTTRIRLMMFSASYNANDPSGSPTILWNELKKAYDRGVDVQVIVDDRTQEAFPKTIQFLQNNNIPWKLDEGEPPRTHAKMIIIDDTVYNGAHNWLKSSLDFVGEAGIMSKDPTTLSEILEYFNNKWAIGRIV